MTKVKSSWEIEENAKYFLESERGAVPGTELQLGIVESIVKNWRDNPAIILDLGCGDGILGRFLMSRFPSAQGIFIDFSDPMLDAARESLSNTSQSTILSKERTVLGNL